MQIKNQEGFCFVSFDALAQSGMVKHCFTTRQGGVSEGVYATMNLSFSRGEERAKVMENYRILCQKMGFSLEDIVVARQSHTDRVQTIGRQDCGKGILREVDFPDCDAMITDVPGIVLSAFGADCVVILLLDPKKKAIAAVHSGWRGTVMQIVKKTVQKMTEVYQTDPKDLIAAISPSIGKCCFQVDLPVAEKFRQAFSFADEIVFDDEGQEGKYKIDLWETNRRILMQAGVLPENIELAALCTKCRTDLFYSHRAMGEERGGQAGFICLCE